MAHAYGMEIAESELIKFENATMVDPTQDE